MMADFRLHLTEEQYAELRQFWREYMLLGPRNDEIGASLTVIALNFSAWIDTDETAFIDGEPCYGLSEIMAFFDEKERREGLAVIAEFTATSVTDA